MPRRTAAAATLTAAALLAGCGLVERVTGTEDVEPRLATVAVLVPEGTVTGGGVAAAVQAGIEDTVGRIDGWTVDVELVDDAVDDATTLADVAEEIAAGDTVAVIGGLSTETIRAVQPIFESRSLLFISPSDTVAEHTRGADPANPLRPYETYFRTATGGDEPLRALSRHVTDVMDIGTVALIDVAGDGEADRFAAAFRGAGGDVVRVDEADIDDGDVPENDGDDADDEDGAGDVPDSGSVEAMVSAASAAGADAVFVTGPTDVAVEVSEELARGGLEMALLGGSALTGDDFLAEAGSSAEGAWTAVAGDLAEAGGRAGDLAERLDGVAPGRHGPAAYDAAAALGTVLNGCLPPADSARAARRGCIGELSEVTVSGYTGDVAFDEYGDRVGAAPVIMVVRDGRWTPASGDH